MSFHTVTVIPNSGSAACHFKADTEETVVDIRKDGLFQCWQPERRADSSPKGHLNTSVQAGVFIRRERESRTKKSGAGEWNVLCM